MSWLIDRYCSRYVYPLFLMLHSTLQLGSLYLLYAKVGHVDSDEYVELQSS